MINLGISVKYSHVKNIKKLLKFENESNTVDFLDHVCSFSLVPKITILNHLSPRSKTLCDNILTTDNTKDTIFGKNTIQQYTLHC